METAAAPKVAPAHVVTLDYDGTKVIANPPVLTVLVGDTVSFQKGVVPGEATLHIVFDNPEYFSASVYMEGDAPVSVTYPIPRGQGTYRCGFAPIGEEPVESALIDGGAIEVETHSGTGR